MERIDTGLAEWDSLSLAREKDRRQQLEANGVCPDSGYTIRWCWTTDLCDCAYAEPLKCRPCGLVVWDLPDHEHRNHSSNQQEES